MPPSHHHPPPSPPPKKKYSRLAGWLADPPPPHSYPLITLSTRAQVESKRADSTFLKAVRHITAREGVSGLYAGLDSALFGISVTNFVYYYWYEWTRAFFEAAAVKAGRASKKLTTVESMIAGAIAGSATVILTNPIWVINTRMTTRKHQAEGEGKESLPLPGGAAPARPARASPAATTTLGTLLAMLRNEGPQALFAGVLPALVLVMNPILQYTLFEQLKNAVERRRRVVTPAIAFLLGALGKLFATSITYPYITVQVAGPCRRRQGGRRRQEDRGHVRRHQQDRQGGGLRRPLQGHRAKGHPERAYRRALVRFQGRPLRTDRKVAPGLG